MVTSLNHPDREIGADTDSIVAITSLAEIPGGAVIDFSRLPEGTKAVMAGHLLVRDTETGDIAALKITEGAYETLPAKKAYAGVLKYAVSARDPRGSVVTAGQINAAASPAPVPAAAKAALSAIVWLYD